MRKFGMYSNYLIFLPLWVLACQSPKPSDGAWLKNSEKEKITQIEQQFRGFDMAMLEINYRYQELYWAGKEKNWQYAQYQLDKIKLSLQNAIIRRPKRQKSTQEFLANEFEKMQSHLTKQDSGQFLSGFQLFTTGCNVCHAKEKMPFFQVKIPIIKTSVIQFSD
ncbi:MAG: hypothetical protein MUE85_06305 [Microscillaceae bacterium]|jgi:hypothetical protein|nr:hypothetical protein [Microscillaceae bacterium]